MDGDIDILTSFVQAERQRTGYPVEPCHAARVLLHKALLAWKGTDGASSNTVTSNTTSPWR